MPLPYALAFCGALAFVPRRRDARQVAALAAAMLESESEISQQNVNLLVTIAKLLRPGGARAVAAWGLFKLPMAA